MKRVFFPLLIFFLGCDVFYPKPMTNDEIIDECKKCKEAGMYAEVVHNSFNYDDVIAVHCLPEKQK